MALALVAGSGSDPAPADRSAAPAGADRATGREEVLAEPVRGSLADDTAVVEAIRQRPWGTGDDPPVAERRVVLATDTPAGRVALVVVDRTAGTRGVWLTGPDGAAAADLALTEPVRLATGRPATLLLARPAGAVLVTVAGRADVVQISPRLVVDATGTATRTWAPVPAPEGIAVVPVADGTAGLAAAVRVWRDGEVEHRGGFALPGGDPPDAAPRTLPPSRPGRPADADVVGEALRRVAQPLGVPPARLAARLLWAAELTRTGGLGSVAVVTAGLPDGGQLVTTHGRVGPPGTGREVPCGTALLPRGTDPGELTVAAVCNVFDGIEVEADRTWLVVTAPAAAVRAEVLDDSGVVLDTVDLVAGGSVSRTPDGTTAVRTLDAAGRPLDVAAVPPGEGFGDYREDDG